MAAALVVGGALGLVGLDITRPDLSEVRDNPETWTEVAGDAYAAAFAEVGDQLGDATAPWIAKASPALEDAGAHLAETHGPWVEDLSTHLNAAADAITAVTQPWIDEFSPDLENAAAAIGTSASSWVAQLSAQLDEDLAAGSFSPVGWREAAEADVANLQASLDVPTVPEAIAGVQAAATKTWQDLGSRAGAVAQEQRAQGVTADPRTWGEAAARVHRPAAPESSAARQ